MKTTVEKIEVMKAYEEGKDIEHRYKNGVWNSIKEPHWDWVDYDYRVKEEPKYRPYKDTEEMINDFCERSGAKRSKMGEPCIWVKEINSIVKRLVVAYFDNSLYTQYCTSFDNWTMKELFEKFTFLDGSPCGIKE